MAGRPQAIIDWRTVDRLLQAGCNATQIASRFAITPDTLYNRCKKDHNQDFSAYSQQKREHGETLLLEKQMEAAMKGDKTMLIWLGKQRLGQKEKHEHSGDDNAGPIRVTLNLGGPPDANG